MARVLAPVEWPSHLRRLVAVTGDEEGTSSDRLAALANSGEAPVTHTTKRAKLEPKSVPSAVSAEVQTQTLFAKNLAFTVTEADLSEAMAQVSTCASSPSDQARFASLSLLALLLPLG